MINTRYALVIASVAVLSGCIGETMFSVELHRESDNAKATCMSSVYSPGLLFAERSQIRDVSRCVTACLNKGFTVAQRPQGISIDTLAPDAVAEDDCAHHAQAIAAGSAPGRKGGDSGAPTRPRRLSQ